MALSHFPLSSLLLNRRPWVKRILAMLWNYCVIVSRVFLVFIVLRLLPILAGSLAPAIPIQMGHSSQGVQIQVHMFPSVV